jgi:hypothetical protein
MKRRLKLGWLAVFGLAMCFAGVLYAQRAPTRKLVVNGKVTDVAVLQVDGRSYVDIETLARITNGSVTIQANQIALTIPNSGAGAPAAQPAQGLSKDFASAAIATLSDMKEWKGALGAMLTFGLAVDSTWAQTYQDRVRTSLAQATVAATTNADQSALQLLNTQFANLAKWESAVVAERKDLNGARTVQTDALQNDPVLVKFSSCSRFLSTMLVSGGFADNANCD